MLLKLDSYFKIVYWIVFISLYLSFLLQNIYIKAFSYISLFFFIILFFCKKKVLEDFLIFNIKYFYIFFIFYSLTILFIYFNILALFKFFIILIFAMIVFLVYDISFKEKNIIILLDIHIILMSFLILLSFINIHPKFYSNLLLYFLSRYEGIFGVNQIAMIASFLGIYTLLAIKFYRIKLLYIFSLTLVIFTLLITASRTSILTFIVSLLLFRFKIPKKILALLLLFNITMIFFSSEIYELIINNINNDLDVLSALRFDKYSLKLRLEGSLYSAFEISKNNQFFPLGISVVNDIKNKYNIFIDNSYLSILLQYGIVGLCLFFIFLVRLIFFIKDRFIFAYFPIVYILFYFENIWSLSLFNILFLVLLGIILRRSNR